MLWLKRSMKLNKFTSHKKKKISFIERDETTFKMKRDQNTSPIDNVQYTVMNFT